MDSTLVVQLTHLASNLGVQARVVLVWWLALHLAVHVLWAAVVLFLIWRGTQLLRHVGSGMRLVDAVKEATDTNYPHSGDFARAVRLILDHWNDKTPKA